MTDGRPSTTASRGETIFAASLDTLRRRTDRVFAGIMSIQWLAGILAATLISPWTWAGAAPSPHVHLWAALLLGGAIAGLPIFLALTRPGEASTRHVIAAAQMLTSGLLIHLSGGRIETHFHVFVSLAFLAFYRDVRVLLTASLVIAADHALRALLWPQSVYGVLAASPWRTVEHAAWIAFEGCVLVLAIRQGIEDLRSGANHQADLEASHAAVENEVEERTRELRASEERFRSLSASSPIGIFETDASGRGVYWNEWFRAIFGVGAEATAGDGWLRTIHPDDRLETLEAWLDAIGRGESIHREFRLLPVGGEERWASLRTRPLEREDGSVAGFVGTVEDVTAQRCAQAESARAREAALETARLKSEFLANMSHEIRTPLNGVIGMTELTLETHLTREQREYLETVKVSADSLLTVIEDILDFSKIEAGKLDLDPVAYDFREDLHRTLRTLALRADKKGIELVGDVHPEVPPLLVADAGRLRQVILNLAGNAIKFTARGEVVVSVDVESRFADHLQLHLCVADSGIGIPAEKQAAIFEAFTQADASTSRRFGGTGLGLAISSRLVAMMNGRIWVESEAGRGSKFHVVVRVGLVPASAQPPGAAAPAPADALDGARVLVVDDNETNRRVLLGALTRLGVSAAAVAEGPAALAELARGQGAGEPYDVAVLDGHMPGMDGFEVAERVRSAPALAATTLMMLTSGGHAGDPDRCRALGVEQYLTKPISEANLRRALAEAMAARRPAPTPAVLPSSPTRTDSRSRAPEETVTARPLSVLVAEDNPVNQLVVTRILEKAGHRVTTAADGAAALECVAAAAFDVVLMDVQMPVLDGFEATREIRRREREAGARRLAIVGLTAHAMKGDRERCLDAGMDAYLTKPVKAPDLLATIGALTAPDESAADPAIAGREAVAFDRALALSNAADEPLLLREVIALWLVDTPNLSAEIEAALAAADSAGVEHAAHRLRGSLGMLGATRAAATAQELERLAAAADLGPAAHAIAGTLRAEVQALRPLLLAVLEEREAA